MTLSIDRINSYAPYKVEIEGETSVCFVTSYGVVYSVGFAEDYSFLESGVYQFYIANLKHLPSPNDPKVRQTIEAIIEEFFRQESPVLLYICDTMDNRQSIRNRLFKHWFNEYIHHDQFEMVNAIVVFDDIEYYAAILLRQDNPRFEEITSSFRTFITELPEKIADLQIS